MSFKEKIENLFHRNKKKSDDELINEELPEGDVGEISFEDVSTEDEVKTLQKKKENNDCWWCYCCCCYSGSCK